MHNEVTAVKALTDFAAKHPDAEAPLDSWYRIAKKTTWESITEVRGNYPHLVSSWIICAVAVRVRAAKIIWLKCNKRAKKIRL